MPRSRAALSTTLVTTLLTAGAASGATLILAVSAAATMPAAPTTSGQVTICHATGSSSHPFTAVLVDASSVLLSGSRFLGGHGDHADDIIPAISVEGTSFPGQNITGSFADVYANGCERLPAASGTPTPTQTPTPTPTSSPTPSSTTSPSAEATGSASPTASASPSASASPTVTASPSANPSGSAPASTPSSSPTPAGGVLVAVGPIVAASGTPSASTVAPDGATVPEDAFTDQELAGEGAVEPLAATIPNAVGAGGGSSAGDSGTPLPAILLMAIGLVTATTAATSLRQR